MIDPISQMTEQEIQEACLKILDAEYRSDATLVGLIIEMLQAWGCSTHIYKHDVLVMRVEHGKSEVSRRFGSLQQCFLHIAIDLGNWSPPVKELTIEERVARLETFLKSKSEQFPDLR